MSTQCGTRQPQWTCHFSMPFSVVNAFQEVQFCSKRVSLMGSLLITTITVTVPLFSAILQGLTVKNHLKMYNTSWCSETKWRLFLLTENISHNVGHSVVYLWRGMVSTDTDCINGVFVPQGASVWINGSVCLTLTSDCGNISGCESKYFFKSCMRNSNTRYSFLPAWTTSNNLTTFGWSSSFSNEISRMAVDGTPSVSLW